MSEVIASEVIASGTAPSGNAASGTAPSGTAAPGTAPSGTAASGVTGSGQVRRMPRVESLTGLRWFAAFGVFLFHADQLAPIPMVHRAFTFGDSGVTFFFVLSGFVLTWSFSSEVSTRTFYWRRFARIWPMLAVSAPIAWIGFHLPWQDAWKALWSLSLLEAWFRPRFDANPVTWSVSCEAFFYLLFPFIVRPLLRVRLRMLGWAAAALLFLEWAYWITVRQFIDHDQFWIQLSWFLRFPPFRLIEFTLGMVVAAALRRGWRPRINLWLAFATVPVTVLVLWAGAKTNLWQPYWSEQGLLPAFTLIVIAAAMRDINGQPSFLRGRTLVMLGTWSYSFYLVHLSVIHWLLGTVVRHTMTWHDAKVTLIWAAVATLAAGACYRFVEHPAEAALRRMYPRRSARSGTLTRATKEKPVG